MTPNEYRKNHKRCATCVYWERNGCDCKVRKITKFGKEGRFCRVYKAKEFKE